MYTMLGVAPVPAMDEVRLPGGRWGGWAGATDIRVAQVSGGYRAIFFLPSEKQLCPVHHHRFPALKRT